MSSKTRIERLEQQLAPGEKIIIGIQDEKDGETVEINHWDTGVRQVETLPNEEAFLSKYPNGFLISFCRNGRSNEQDSQT